MIFMVSFFLSLSFFFVSTFRPADYCSRWIRSRRDAPNARHQKSRWRDAAADSAARFGRGPQSSPVSSQRQTRHHVARVQQMFLDLWNRERVDLVDRERPLERELIRARSPQRRKMRPAA